MLHLEGAVLTGFSKYNINRSTLVYPFPNNIIGLELLCELLPITPAAFSQKEMKHFAFGGLGEEDK